MSWICNIALLVFKWIWEKISNRKDPSKILSDNKVGNKKIITIGNGARVSGSIFNGNIYNGEPKDERPHKLALSLSAIEKEVLLALSEGAGFAITYDEDGALLDTCILGNDRAKILWETKKSLLVSAFQSLCGKGLLDFKHGDLKAAISAFGREVVQELYTIKNE